MFGGIHAETAAAGTADSFHTFRSSASCLWQLQLTGADNEQPELGFDARCNEQMRSCHQFRHWATVLNKKVYFDPVCDINKNLMIEENVH